LADPSKKRGSMNLFPEVESALGQSDQQDQACS
jgi:hypothetical protein